MTMGYVTSSSFIIVYFGLFLDDEQSIDVTNSGVASMDKSIHSQEYRIFLKTLRQVRKSAKVTQVDLAERLGTTQTVISKCERGERRVDVIELREWCLALGVGLDEFGSMLETAIRKRT